MGFMTPDPLPLMVAMTTMASSWSGNTWQGGGRRWCWYLGGVTDPSHYFLGPVDLLDDTDRDVDGLCGAMLGKAQDRECLGTGTGNSLVPAISGPNDWSWSHGLVIEKFMLKMHRNTSYMVRIRPI